MHAYLWPKIHYFGLIYGKVLFWILIFAIKKLKMWKMTGENTKNEIKFRRKVNEKDGNSS